jgi:uncharacterized membrane protein YgdD (TMEM256/DUF423 family)
MIDFLNYICKMKSTNSMRKLPVVSSLLAGLAVAMGAIGAHWFAQQSVAPKAIDIYNKASFYLLIHAVAVTALCLIKNTTNWTIKSNRPIWLMFWGALVFSVSVYLVAFSYLPHLEALKMAGAIAPIGGIGMILAWIELAYEIYKHS